MHQSVIRVVAASFMFVSTVAVESSHVAAVADARTRRHQLDVTAGVDGDTFDVRPDTDRTSLTFDGEQLVFERDSYQRIADGIDVWTGKNEKDAAYLYIAKDGDHRALKLAKGSFEYDIYKNPG